MTPTHEDVQKRLSYDAETGEFTWLPYRDRTGRPSQRPGQKAGTVNNMGYVAINVLRRPYLAHRLAWLLTHGEWPRHHIDHINGDKQDNRLANLRDVPSVVNMQNLRKATKANRSSGLLGAWWSKAAGRWRSQIKVLGKLTHLGLFDTAEEAHAAYVEAKRRLHEGCTI